MQTKKLHIALILIFLLPVLFYVLPANQYNLVPAVKNHLNIIYPVIIILFTTLYSLLLIIYWRTPQIKKSHKWIVTILTVIVLIVHYCSFILIEVGNFQFESSQITMVSNFDGKKIYIREWQGLFKAKANSEVVYTRPLSLFYHVYYTTPNNIELIKKEPEKLVFEDFRYVADSIQPKGFFRKIQSHIQVDSIIQITKKDL